MSVRPRILNVEPDAYSDAAREVISSVGILDEIELTREDLLSVISRYDVLIVRLRHSIDRTVIDAGKRLKVIVSATTGLDHIDVPYAESRGIEVLSLRGETDFLASIKSTAEHTWALLLGLARRLPAAHQHVVKGGWDRDAYRGSELSGRHLGVIGLGRIGSMVAEYGFTFGLEVSAFDPSLEHWPLRIKRCGSLEDLALAANILTLHVPLTASTTDLIDARVLELLGPKGLLVNTSRGEIVDEDALVDGLVEGTISGAALDVIRDERGNTDPEARRVIAYAKSHDNLVLTPHIGGATLEAMAKTERVMAYRLRDHISGSSTSPS